MPLSCIIPGDVSGSFLIQKQRNREVKSAARKMRTLPLECMALPSLQTTFWLWGVKTETKELGVTRRNQRCWGGGVWGTGWELTGSRVGILSMPETLKGSKSQKGVSKIATTLGGSSPPKQG